MLQTPASTGGARRDSLPFSETGSLGDDTYLAGRRVLPRGGQGRSRRRRRRGRGSAPRQLLQAGARAAAAAGRRLRGRLAAEPPRHASITNAARARGRAGRPARRAARRWRRPSTMTRTTSRRRPRPRRRRPSPWTPAKAAGPRRHVACETAGLALRRRGADRVARDRPWNGRCRTRRRRREGRWRRRAPAVLPQPRPTAWVTGDGHITFVRPVPRRFELNAAALPAVGGPPRRGRGRPLLAHGAPAAADSLGHGGGALTARSPRRRSEPLQPSGAPGGRPRRARTRRRSTRPRPPCRGRGAGPDRATATLFHLPAGPEAPPAVVRVSDMGPTLEQSATSNAATYPRGSTAAAGGAASEGSLPLPPTPSDRGSRSRGHRLDRRRRRPRPTFVKRCPPGPACASRRRRHRSRQRAPPRAPATRCRRAAALFRSPAAPKTRKRAPLSPKPTAWVVGRGTTAAG